MRSGGGATAATNTRKRGLTPEQRANVVLKLLDIMRARAKALKGNAPGGRVSPKLQANLPETSDNVVHFPTESAQVRDEVAKQAGVRGQQVGHPKAGALGCPMATP